MRSIVVTKDEADMTKSPLIKILKARVDANGPCVSHPQQIENRLLKDPAELVVVGFADCDEEEGLQLLQKVRRLTSGYILALGSITEPHRVLHALREGADYYVDEADLERSLTNVLSRIQGKTAAANGVGHILGVLGVTGGAGASTLAVNLAAALARDHGKTLLVDMDLARGDQTVLLDCKAVFTLADICRNRERLDQEMFEKTLISHKSGIQLLAAPQNYEDIDVVTPEGIQQALLLAARLFDHLVIDFQDCFHKDQVTAVRLTNTLLLVVQLDFASLRNARRVLDHLKTLGFPREQVHLVVNRRGVASQLSDADAEWALGLAITHFVPEDAKTINEAINSGLPVVLNEPSAKISRVFSQLARQTVASKTKRKEPPSMLKSAWAKLFSR